MAVSTFQWSHFFLFEHNCLRARFFMGGKDPNTLKILWNIQKLNHFFCFIQSSNQDKNTLLFKDRSAPLWHIKTQLQSLIFQHVNYLFFFSFANKKHTPASFSVSITGNKITITGNRFNVGVKFFINCIGLPLNPGKKHPRKTKEDHGHRKKKSKRNDNYLERLARFSAKRRSGQNFIHIFKKTTGPSGSERMIDLGEQIQLDGVEVGVHAYDLRESRVFHEKTIVDRQDSLKSKLKITRSVLIYSVLKLSRILRVSLDLGWAYTNLDKILPSLIQYVSFPQAYV
ncbi:uncharacterized protein EV154DRAFT_554749 [Mucor mucedo]|uniref:uncharacterized protein n=1 Tax=Mucor mucedo TaxID=29922 RepID=UPI00221FF159|nr:uncharacterized protein EV154DRAFT_554749 [Mucor mucedo]KAI7885424.1 hypothetical protein EV154DRAFT_554749 [Mucor mucedo]